MNLKNAQLDDTFDSRDGRGRTSLNAEIADKD